MIHRSSLERWWVRANVEGRRRLAYRRARALDWLDAAHARIDGGAPFELASPWPVQTPPNSLILRPLDNLVLRRRIAVAGLPHTALERTVALNFKTWTGLLPEEVYWTAQAETGEDGHVRAVTIAVIDKREVDRLQELVRRNGCRCDYLDLDVGRLISLSARARPWSSGELAALVAASVVWFAAAASAWSASRTAVGQVQAQLETARTHIAEQGRLQNQIRGLERRLNEQGERSRRLLSRSLADASATFSGQARLEEFLWEQGTLTLRLVTSDPDQVAASGRSIADDAGLQQIGGLIAASGRDGDGFRVSLRFRTKR